MLRNSTFILFVICLLFGWQPLQAQLNPGDIMFVGFAGDGNGLPDENENPDANCEDAFAFAALVDIPANTTIYFSEDVYNGTAFVEEEGDVSWSNTAVTPAGTIVNVITHEEVDGCAPITASVGTAQFVTVSATGSWALSSSNQDLYAYLGSVHMPTVWLAAFFTDTSNGVNVIPAELNGFVVDLTSVDADADVAVLSGDVDCDNREDCLAYITNLDNWITEDDIGFGACCDDDGINYPEDLPDGLQACDLPVINGVTIVDCSGGLTGQVTLEVNGELNGAAGWEWTNVNPSNFPCDGNDIPIIFTTAQVTGFYLDFIDETFYVRAVGGCLDEPVCFAFVPSELLGQPAMIALETSTYCADAGVQTGLTGGSPAGGVYSGTGITDDGNGMTFTFDPAAVGVGATTLTYTYNTGTVCGESTATTTITVAALPTVTFTAPGPFDADDAAVMLTGGMPAGGTYSGPGVADGNFDPAAAGGGTHTITYTYTDGNGCTASATGDIVVGCEAPVINGVTLVDCGNGVSGVVTLEVDGELNGATTWQWLFLDELCESNFADVYAVGSQVTGDYFDLINETFYVRAVGGCLDEPVCFAFVPSELLGQPAMIALETSTYCADAGVQTGLTGGSPAGGVYSGTGITDDGNGMTFTFDPAAVGVGATTLTYTYNTGTVCGESTATTTITVAALPTVTFTAPGPFDAGDAAVMLTGGMPAGGTYSGPGVTDGNFDPAAAGAGTHTITYTYTDGNGCTASATGEITVTQTLPPDNACSGANDISALFGQTPNEPQTSALFDNTGYNSDSDPATGYECFDDGTLERTTWYTFIGDGNTYQIKTVECTATNYLTNGDTQIAIYSGDCATPTAVACSEDEDFANNIYNANVELMTEAGVTYLVMIDGWTGADYSAEGEFCIEVTNLTPSSVTSIEHTDIAIYPNPTTDQVYLQNVVAEQVDVLDNTGRLVSSQLQPGNTVNLSNLPAGVYLLRIATEEAVYSAKVMKQD